jgi:hypothetical protein
MEVLGQLYILATLRWGKGSPGTHQIESWVSSRPGLDKIIIFVGTDLFPRLFLSIFFLSSLIRIVFGKGPCDSKMKHKPINTLYYYKQTYTTAVNNFVDCGCVTLYYKILTLTRIHILPQNSCHLPLCKSINVGLAAGNTAEKYLQESPLRLPLW